MRTRFLASATLIGTIATAACAGSGYGPAPASEPSPAPAPTPTPTPAPPAAAATVMQQAARAEVPKPAAVDLTGTYAVSTAYGGQPLDVTLYLVKNEDGSPGGSLEVPEAGAIPFTSITITGTRVQASLNSPDGSVVTMEFTIEAGVLDGGWRSSAGDSAAMRGRKM